MTLAQLLNDNDDELTDSDLGTLADWASKKKFSCPDEWKRAYSLIREGSDLLLRRRAVKTEKKG